MSSFGNSYSLKIAKAENLIRKAYADIVVSQYRLMRAKRIKLSKNDVNSRLIDVPSIRGNTRDHPSKQIILACKNLYENVIDGRARNVDFGLCMVNLGHERAHLDQQLILFQEPELTAYQRDGARMDLIASVFKGYYHHAYRYMPTELDAEARGFRLSFDWLSKAFTEEFADALLDSVVADEDYWKVRGASNWREAVAILESRRDDYLSEPCPPVIGSDDVRSGLLNKIEAESVWMSEIVRVASILDRAGNVRRKGEPRPKCDDVLLRAALDFEPGLAVCYRGLDGHIREIIGREPSRLKKPEPTARQIRKLLDANIEPLSIKAKDEILSRFSTGVFAEPKTNSEYAASRKPSRADDLRKVYRPQDSGPDKPKGKGGGLDITD